MVNARVVGNVDRRTNGRTYGRTNGRKTGSLYRAMPEAGATKMILVHISLAGLLSSIYTVIQSSK